MEQLERFVRQHFNDMPRVAMQELLATVRQVGRLHRSLPDSAGHRHAVRVSVKQLHACVLRLVKAAAGLCA